MQDAGLSNNIFKNGNVALQNGQLGSSSVSSEQKQSQQTNSIFNKNAGMSDVNQSNTNSHGTGGLDNIFMGGGSVQQSFDNTSIFAGLNRGTRYALYSKKDASYDVPKLTQEDIANQKAAEGQKRTNPKAYNVDITPKANPFEAFRNPEYQEDSFGEKISSAIAGIFNGKKAN